MSALAHDLKKDECQGDERKQYGQSAQRNDNIRQDPPPGVSHQALAVTTAVVRLTRGLR